MQLVWLMGEAASLLSPVDSRNILTAVCHHPVTVQADAGQTALSTIEAPDSAPQGCACLCAGSVPADTQPSLVSVDAPKEEPKWVLTCRSSLLH